MIILTEAAKRRFLEISPYGVPMDRSCAWTGSGYHQRSRAGWPCTSASPKKATIGLA